MGGPLAWRLAPAVVAALVAAGYLIGEVRTADLAAAEFRAELFGREGFTIWNGNWYGGHHTPAYSVLFPPLAWLFGPNVVGAVSAVAAAAIFDPLARARWGERARWGVVWFGLGAAATLFVGRLPFLLGVAIGLGALLALQRERRALAVALALACPLASPVAALFLALAGLAHSLARSGWLEGWPRRLRGAASDASRALHRRNGHEARWSAAVAAAALAPPLLLSAAFPEGGEQPFPWSHYKRVALFVIACLVALPRGERTLRIGAALYGVGATAAYLLPTPVGSNAGRLGILFGGPLLLCAVAGRVRGPIRLAALALVLAALAWWQLAPSVRHAIKVRGPDPAGDAAYYRPVVAFLERAAGPPGRVEIPFTATHREAAEVGVELPLARGWERQLDVSRNQVFYEGALDADRYERWLRENGVRWVALPDAAPDYSSQAEMRLIRAGLPFLHERWRDRHWRVYEVVPRPRMLVQERGAPIALVQVGADRATLRAAGGGTATLRVRWTPYWHLSGGCVEPAGDWTRVTSERSGELALETRFSPQRLVERGRRCD